jgi:hypothetical protein
MLIGALFELLLALGISARARATLPLLAMRTVQ